MMYHVSMKLSTNNERLTHLERLCLDGNRAQAERLAFEWVKTGVFALKEFSAFIGFCVRAQVV